VLRFGLSVLLLAVALGPLGCAGAPPARPAAPVAPLRAATLDEVRAAYDGYCRGIETLSASGDLDVRDGRTGKSQRLGVRLVATRGGRLYLKGSVAVVTALEVVANADRFWFQVPSRKTVWTGSSSASAEGERSEAPYYALRPSDIALAFLPEPLTPAPGEALVFESDRQSFSLTLVSVTGESGVPRRRVWLERESLAWIRARSFDERGELRSEVGVAGWTQGRPRQVVISRPGEGYVAAFTLDKLEANVTIPERAFQPRTPEGYKVVEVR
jgi:hypothetical protein